MSNHTTPKIAAFRSIVQQAGTLHAELWAELWADISGLLSGSVENLGATRQHQ
jgi:hypothetical protein